VRRQLNRAFLVRIEIDVDVTETTLAEPWEALTAAAAHVRVTQTTGRSRERMAAVAGGPDLGVIAWGPSTTNSDLGFQDRGSSMNPLVELGDSNP
jgi:hypothetical protein